MSVAESLTARGGAGSSSSVSSGRYACVRSVRGLRAPCQRQPLCPRGVVGGVRACSREGALHSRSASSQCLFLVYPTCSFLIGPVLPGTGRSCLTRRCCGTRRGAATLAAVHCEVHAGAARQRGRLPARAQQRAGLLLLQCSYNMPPTIITISSATWPTATARGQFPSPVSWAVYFGTSAASILVSSFHVVRPFRASRYWV